jgi:hypothetical protein
MRGGGQGRGRTADLPIFRAKDASPPSPAHVRDRHRGTDLNAVERGRTQADETTDEPTTSPRRCRQRGRAHHHRLLTAARSGRRGLRDPSVGESGLTAAGEQVAQLRAVLRVARVLPSLIDHSLALGAVQKVLDLAEDRGHHGSLGVGVGAARLANASRVPRYRSMWGGRPPTPVACDLYAVSQLRLRACVALGGGVSRYVDHEAATVLCSRFPGQLVRPTPWHQRQNSCALALSRGNALAGSL